MGTIKTFALALALAVVCLGLIVGGVRTPATTMRWKTMRWNQIGHWSGSGKGSTPTFTVAASRWRFRWTARPSPNTPGGRMHVYVFRDGERALIEDPVRRWVDFPVGDEALVLSGPGTYWLRCDCPQVEWTLDVDQIVD